MWKIKENTHPIVQNTIQYLRYSPNPDFVQIEVGDRLGVIRLPSYYIHMHYPRVLSILKVSDRSEHFCCNILGFFIMGSKGKHTHSSAQYPQYLQIGISGRSSSGTILGVLPLLCVLSFTPQHPKSKNLQQKMLRSVWNFQNRQYSRVVHVDVIKL